MIRPCVAAGGTGERVTGRRWGGFDEISANSGCNT